MVSHAVEQKRKLALKLLQVFLLIFRPSTQSMLAIRFPEIYLALKHICNPEPISRAETIF